MMDKRYRINTLIVLIAFLPTRFAISPTSIHMALSRHAWQTCGRKLVAASAENYELEAIMCNKAANGRHILVNFSSFGMDRNNIKDVMRVRRQIGIIAGPSAFWSMNPMHLITSEDLKLVKSTISELKECYIHLLDNTLLPFQLALALTARAKRIVTTIGEKKSGCHQTFWRRLPRQN